MKVGTQCIAEAGWATLQKGLRYSFLKNDLYAGFATFVLFTTQTEGRRVHIVRLTNDLFAQGIDERRILPAPTQLTLPPWLSTVEGANLEMIDEDRQEVVETNFSRCEHRFGFIRDLVPRLNEILAAKNPFSIINEHAKQCIPAQNRTRLAEWFFAYVCFETQTKVLYPEYPNTGTYDKTLPKFNTAHFGRVSVDKGAHHGYPSAMFTEEIRDYLVPKIENNELTGKTKHSIYEDAVKDHWGARGRMDKEGRFELYHPEGKPFPMSEGTFWYRAHQAIGRGKIDLGIYGQYRLRNQAASKGSYSEEVSNFLAEMEVDGYYRKERPRVAVGEGPSHRLCVVRGICVGTKYRVGIGFSFENETHKAYRSMLFSAAIPREKLYQLWGLTPEATLPWLYYGLSAHLIADRGGAPVAAIINELQSLFPVRELTESYSGQSKPNVESSNPKTLDLKGPPTYTVSDKNVSELIQREICRTAMENHTNSVINKIIGPRAEEKLFCSPHALVQYLDRLGLTDAQQISFDTAVRTFLEPVCYELREGAFWFQTRSYSSRDIERTQIYDELASGQRIEIRGYQYEMNLNFAWVEVKGRLYELTQKLPVRLGEAERMATVEQIRHEAEYQRLLRSQHPKSATAAEVEAKTRFEECTGLSWGDTERKAGKPKISAASAIEKRVLSNPNRRKPKAA
jgi:hypothetical protein